MTAIFSSEQERLDLERSAEPGWIESSGGPAFAWYHPPRGPVRSRAVLLCDPLISDRMNLHLTYRHLALRLAASGYPTLRFDYPGTGDSSGAPRDPGWSSFWHESQSAASEVLRSRSGVPRVAAFGARFGGSLAVEFAARSPEVDSLLLWGPYVSGRDFLRNARAMHKLTGANPARRRPSRFDPDDEEFFGYLLNREARDRIESIRLLELTESPCAYAHVIAWDEHTKEDQLADQLTQLGTQVVFERIEDLASEESLTRQALPEPVIARLLDGLDREPTPIEDNRDAKDDQAAVHTRIDLPTRATVRRSAAVDGEVAEQCVSFGAGGDLFGILTMPLLATPVGAADGTRPATCMILVNGGNNHRAGINRNYTEWARDAALRGVPTLRFDIRGLGDSPPLLERDLNRLYRDETRLDVIAAIDHMTERMPGSRIVLCGLCAGAYQALHATLVDDRVETLVLFDLLKWDRDMPDVRVRGFFARRTRQLRRWRDRLRAVSGLSVEPEPNSLGRWLLELTENGVEVVAIGCRASGGFADFDEALSGVRPQLAGTGRFRLEGLDDTDHVFSPIWVQEQLSSILVEVLEG